MSTIPLYTVGNANYEEKLQNKGVNSIMTAKQYLESILYTKEEVNNWLSGKHSRLQNTAVNLDGYCEMPGFLMELIIPSVHIPMVSIMKE